MCVCVCVCVCGVAVCCVLFEKSVCNILKNNSVKHTVSRDGKIHYTGSVTFQST